MSHGRLADTVRIRGWEIDVAWPVLLVAQMALALEQAEHTADRGIGRRIGEIGEDLRGVRAPAPVDDLHDLPLATSELIQSGLLHRASQFRVSQHPEDQASLT